MPWCIVDTPGDQDQVECESLSFDGGSLILFSDATRQAPKVAYSPGGWLRWRWRDGSVQAESQSVS